MTNLVYGVRVVSSQYYRLKTITVHSPLLVLVLQGQKKLIGLDETIVVKSGQVVMVAKETQWDVVNDPDGSSSYEAIALSMDDELIASFYSKLLKTSQQVVSTATTILANELLSESLLRTLPSVSGYDISDTMLQHRIQEVLLCLHEMGYMFSPNPDQSFATQIRSVVMQHPQAQWDVKTLAAHFYMSESTLRRRMPQNMTAAALIKETRLELALGLLQTTALSIGEVADHCGWSSHSRFTNSFQKRWGVTPSVVRSKLKESG